MNFMQLFINLSNMKNVDSNYMGDCGQWDTRLNLISGFYRKVNLLNFQGFVNRELFQYLYLLNTCIKSIFNNITHDYIAFYHCHSFAIFGFC